MEKNNILVINPGAISTKFAVFADDQPILKKTLEHEVIELEQFARVFDQYTYRLELILKELAKANIELNSINAVVGRGGLVKPLAGGTYRVSENMLSDLKEGKRGEHASNLGAVIAYNIASKLNIPAFIVDPVSVDEMEPVARISGLPDIDRTSLSHALNMKAVAHKVAKELGKGYQEFNFVVAHLGSGVSVTPHKRGRMIDVNNAIEEGPFSPDRCGGLPATQLMNLCYSGKYTHKEMKEKLISKGGLFAYLGVKDLREIEKMAVDGNQQAVLLLNALSYQVSKEIAAMSAVLEGQVDRIIITGGIAHSKRITDDIIKRVKFIAPVILVPGEEELGSLAMGALRVLRREEVAKEY
ncbi:MAG: butyrate kinase [Desulfitibacter sp. BRH_c19]|nr:MAG: butyrate kinase [Desulfitibacter sp. BRH_c19]